MLDRLVGYELSPLLWKKVKPGLSAGRVQSVAVRLIVEREEEIKNFKGSSAFRITAQFTFEKDGQKHQLQAELPERFEKEEKPVSFCSHVSAQATLLAILKRNRQKNRLLHHLLLLLCSRKPVVSLVFPWLTPCV